MLAIAIYYNTKYWGEDVIMNGDTGDEQQFKVTIDIIADIYKLLILYYYY